MTSFLLGLHQKSWRHDTFTHLLLATSKISWTNKRFSWKIKSHGGFGELFWVAKTWRIFYEKNEPGSFTPRQSNCKKRGDFFTWRHRSDPESTSFCRGFYHDPTNSSLIFPLRFFLASDHVFWPLFNNGTYGKQGPPTSTWDGVEMGVCLRSKECWRKMAPDKNTMIQYITCQVWLGARSLTKNAREESLVNRDYLFPKGRKSFIY